jgi:phytoene desaturase
VSDVAVVGAGPGGLAAAMLMAASGVKVTIYEAGATVGGRTSRITLRDERDRAFHFDRGPTFFLMPYVLEEIFNATGRRLQDYADLTRLDPMYRLVLGREGQSPLIVETTQDLERMSAQLDQIERGAGAQFKRFLSDNRTKLDRMTPILRRPIRGLGDLITLDTMKCGPVLAPHKSVHTLLGKYFDDPLVKIALTFQSKYLGMSPMECPSLFTILPFIEYEYGIWHPRGGCNALMHAMAEVCQDMGVTIHTSSPVERIAFNGSRAGGVVVDGDTIAHEHVVVNADATWAMKNLIPENLRRPQDCDAKIDDKRYSCSTYMLYLGLEGKVDLPHHTIYVSRTYEDNLKDITQRGALTKDCSTYVCNPGATDPTMAPDGCSSLYVLVPTPNCSAKIDWMQADPIVRERALDIMEREMGIEHARERIVCEQRITPSDWRAANINFGATFNLAHNLGQMLHKRPHHELKGVENVWLVGGGTHPGSGLPVIFLSSQITAKLLCDRVGAQYAGV